MNSLGLCSGIGGLELAGEAAGFTTVAMVEKDPFCQKILKQHFEGVEIYDDVFGFTTESLSRRGIERASIGLITAGFPCQPYSFAGKRLGNADDRAIWPEIMRIISQIQPVYVVLENVPGLISLALDGVLSSLEKANYEAGAFVFPACAVNAPHRRDRLFIVAHTRSNDSNARRAYATGQSGQTRFTDGRPVVADAERAERRPPVQELSNQGQHSLFAGQPENTTGFSPGRQTIPDASRTGLEEREGAHGKWSRAAITGSDWWAVEPGLGRMVAGVSNRVDRLRALGNAVVPAQAYPVFKAIADYERSVQG